MGTPLSHGWQELQGTGPGFHLGRGPTGLGAEEQGWESPAGTGTSGPAVPNPSRAVSGEGEPGRLVLPHRMLQLPSRPSDSPQKHRVLSPSHELFPACGYSAFPRADTCSRAPMSCPDSVSPCLDRGIAFTSMQVCGRLQRPG